jgi:predicted nucleic acid-binding Zn ribbon protein
MIGDLGLADGEYRPYTIALSSCEKGEFRSDSCCMEDGNWMPIYVYERPDGSRFEFRQGFNDNALTEDPETGVVVRRIMQPAPIISKGSGWYKTDSRASNANGATEKKAPEAAAATSAEKGEKGEKAAETTTSAKEAVSDATAKTTAEIKKTAEKPATPAAAS